jgi:NAD(P)-dependent dehydrogenase (short-subunit alcohol dehydrogenase family)
LELVVQSFASIASFANLPDMSPDTLSLAGKTALVTGSGRETGIGAGIARAFARNGASVAIHYVSEESKARAEKVAADINEEFGTKTTVVQGGVENYNTAKSMVEQILKAFGVDHIDILGMSWVAGCSFQVVGQY